jgi:hypothetical protein
LSSSHLGGGGGVGGGREGEGEGEVKTRCEFFTGVRTNKKATSMMFSTKPGFVSFEKVSY